MIFNKHSNLEGCHAFLGASNNYWLNYDPDKLITTYRNRKAAEEGTKLHAFAKQCIDLHQKLAYSKKTLNRYVNDAIGFGMQAEVLLFYSPICFGTADAISFENDFLRIHDLKTGVLPVKVEQLYIYAALFCLEYRKNPSHIQIELRIYQNDDMEVINPDPGDIQNIMDLIVQSDAILSRYIAEEG